MNRSIALAVASLILAAGCSRTEPPPRSLAEAKRVAAASLTAVNSARGRKDFPSAAKAVARAQQAADFANGVLARHPVSPAENALSRDILAVAGKAKHVGDLAAEEGRFARTVLQMRSGTYGVMRDLAVQLSFMSMVRAARQAKARSIEKPPRAPRLSATVAADVASYCGRAGRADGSPDWDGVASDMERMSLDQPPVVKLIFMTGFMICGQDVLALYEIESIDPRQIKTSGERSLYHLLRSVVLARSGSPNLALEEAERSASALEGDPTAAGPEWLSTVHVILACAYLSQRDFAGADRESTSAASAWPGNPLLVVLDGERIAASGDCSRAAASCDVAANGISNVTWLAEKLHARARDLRDKKGAVLPLFADSTFVCDVLSPGVAGNASAPAPRQLARFVSGARWFAQKVAENLK